MFELLRPLHREHESASIHSRALNRLECEQEGRHNSDHRSSPTHSPEQIRVLCGFRTHHAAISSHHLHLQQIVARQAILTRKESAATTEGRACNTSTAFWRR